MIGTQVFSQASPERVEQLCMSWQAFGVTKLNAGSRSAVGDSAWRNAPVFTVPSGTSHLVHSAGTGLRV